MIFSFISYQGDGVGTVVLSSVQISCWICASGETVEVTDEVTADVEQESERNPVAPEVEEVEEVAPTPEEEEDDEDEAVVNHGVFFSADDCLAF